MSRPKNIPAGESLLNVIRAARAKLGRNPGSRDIPDRLCRAARAQYGSLRKAVLAATGEEPKRLHRSDEELIAYLLAVSGGRVLGSQELREIDYSLMHTLRNRFGSVNAAYERALGYSIRTHVLGAIVELTRNDCLEATGAEIADYLASRGHRYTLSQIAQCAASAIAERHITSARSGRTTTVYSITPAGRDFLSYFNQEKK